MKYFEVGVWRTQYGFYCIRADTDAVAKDIATDFLQQGEPFTVVRDGDVGVGYIERRKACVSALTKHLEKFDVPQ